MRSRYRDVKELFGTGEGWCQGSIAKNKLGFQVKVDSEDACAWCLMGAVDKVKAPVKPVYQKLRMAMCYFNDASGRKFADVAALLDELIEEDERDNPA